MGRQSRSRGNSTHRAASGYYRVDVQAEGGKMAVVLEAEGQKQSAILRADGQAQAITTVYNAIHDGKPTNDLIAIKYLETLEKVADGKATKIFLPMELTGMAGSIGGMAELVKGEKAEEK